MRLGVPAPPLASTPQIIAPLPFVSNESQLGRFVLRASTLKPPAKVEVALIPAIKPPVWALTEKMGLVPAAVVVARLNEPALFFTVEVAAVLYCRVRVGADELANRISLESKKA